MHPMSPARPRLGRTAAPAVNGFGVVIACGPTRPEPFTRHPMRLGLSLAILARGMDKRSGAITFREVNQTRENAERASHPTLHPMRYGMARVHLKRMGLL